MRKVYLEVQVNGDVVPLPRVEKQYERMVILSPSQFPMPEADIHAVEDLGLVSVGLKYNGLDTREKARVIFDLKELTEPASQGFGQRARDPINDKCSFVLRFEVEDLSEAEILSVLRNAYRIEPIIATLIPGSRRRGCSAFNLLRETHRDASSVNLISTNHAGVEYQPADEEIIVRYSGGTRTEEKMVYWLDLWEAIIKRSIIDPEPCYAENLKELLAWAGFHEADDIEWYETRVEELEEKRMESLQKKAGFDYPGLLFLPNWDEEDEENSSEVKQPEADKQEEAE